MKQRISGFLLSFVFSFKHVGGRLGDFRLAHNKKPKMNFVKGANLFKQTLSMLVSFAHIKNSIRQNLFQQGYFAMPAPGFTK